MEKSDIINLYDNQGNQISDPFIVELEESNRYKMNYIKLFESFNDRKFIKKGTYTLSKTTYQSIIDLFPNGELIQDILQGIPDILSPVMIPCLYRSKGVMLVDDSWYFFTNNYTKEKDEKYEIYFDVKSNYNYRMSVCVFGEESLELNIDKYYSKYALEPDSFNAMIESSIRSFSIIGKKVKPNDSYLPGIKLCITKSNNTVSDIMELKEKLQNIDLTLIQTSFYAENSNSEDSLGDWFVIIHTSDLDKCLSKN